MSKLTPIQYTVKGGVICPNCGSGDLEGWGVEVDAGFASQDVGCNNCGSTWTDNYTLTGYADFQKGDDE